MCRGTSNDRSRVDVSSYSSGLRTNRNGESTTLVTSTKSWHTYELSLLFSNTHSHYGLCNMYPLQSSSPRTNHNSEQTTTVTSTEALHSQ